MSGSKTGICVIAALLMLTGCCHLGRWQDLPNYGALFLQSQTKKIKIASFPAFLSTAIKKQQAAYEKLETCTDEAQLRQSWPEIRAVETELRDRTLEYAKLLDEEGKLVFTYILNKIADELDEVIDMGDLNAWDDEEEVSYILEEMNRVLRDYRMSLQTLSAEIDYCSP